MACSEGAVLIYNEALSGDLSGGGATPTVLGTLMAGTNTVSGTMGGTPIDADIFTFSIAPGEELSAISLTSYSLSSGSLGSGGSFFSVGAGSTIGAPSVEGSFGFTITSTPGPLFSASLPAGPGDYTMWIQETAGGMIDYTVSFVVVPEPSSVMLGAIASLAFLRRRRPC